MGCGWYRIGDATVHINFGGRQAPAPCVVCRGLSVALCDAPAGQDHRGAPVTCDAPLCEQHRVHAGRNLDYCPRHQGLASRLPLE